MPKASLLLACATIIVVSLTLHPLQQSGVHITPARRRALKSSCVNGFFSDWTEWSLSPGRLRTTGAFLSDAEGLSPSKHFTLVGSDDGDAFWTLHGHFAGGAHDEFVVDFSPKGGPPSLGGRCDGADRILWADGNSWWREPSRRFAGWAKSQPLAHLKYLSQAEAAAVDALLMRSPGLSVEALMELSGLAVAHAVLEVYPPEHYPKVIACLGPGGNGGDGMVAARHLASLGYAVSAYYPKRNPNPPYANLVASLTQMGVRIIDSLPSPSKTRDTVVLDAVFGFSFRPPLRAPFGDVLARMSQHANVVAVDVPSGWDVDVGPPTDGTILPHPAVLVSLMAPKLCSKAFTGREHYLGKVLMPPAVGAAHELVPAATFGSRQILRLQRLQSV